MALVNIGEDNKDDGFYRYKMPRLMTKIEGRGNGIKTNLVNMVDVAKALARPPAYTTKFFGCVLGAQSKFDDKTGVSTVNGAHDTSTLVKHLEVFIKKYVQCYGCGNPETEIIITKTQMIQMKCAACGYVSDVDMRDKLTTFILNNPPEAKKLKSKGMRRAEKERLKAGESLDEDPKKVKGKKKKGDDEKKEKKSSKKGQKEEDQKESPEASQQGDENDEDDDDDIEWQTDTSAAAAEARIKEQLSAATSEMVMVSTNGADSPKKVKTPKESFIAKKSPKVAPKVEEEEEEEEEQVSTQLKELSLHDKLVQDLKDYIATHSLAEVASHVQAKGTLTSGLMVALFEALFDGYGKGVHKEVAKKKALLLKIVPDEESQIMLLKAVEVYFGKTNPDALKEVAHILKVVYDEDVVEEEQILAWYDDKTSGTALGLTPEQSATVKSASAPFVKWLRDAEPESEEE
eukprot:jgi/Mesen1/5551/ME000280S04668